MPRRRNGFPEPAGRWTLSSRISRSLEKPSHHPYASTNWIRFEGSPRCLKASGISARCPGSPGEWRNLEATAPGLSSRLGPTTAPLPRALRLPPRHARTAGEGRSGCLVAWLPDGARRWRPAAGRRPALFPRIRSSQGRHSICLRIAPLIEAPCKLSVRLFCAYRPLPRFAVVRGATRRSPPRRRRGPRRPPQAAASRPAAAAGPDGRATATAEWWQPRSCRIRRWS